MRLLAGEGRINTQWRAYAIQPKRPLSALTEQIREKREFALWKGRLFAVDVMAY